MRSWTDAFPNVGRCGHPGLFVVATTWLIFDLMSARLVWNSLLLTLAVLTGGTDQSAQAQIPFQWEINITGGKLADQGLIHTSYHPATGPTVAIHQVPGIPWTCRLQDSTFEYPTRSVQVIQRKVVCAHANGTTVAADATAVASASSQIQFYQYTNDVSLWGFDPKGGDVWVQMKPVSP